MVSVRSSEILLILTKGACVFQLEEREEGKEKKERTKKRRREQQRKSANSQSLQGESHVSQIRKEQTVD